jgi:hypothetical protein
MRLTRNPDAPDAEAEPWDPADPGPFARLAGGQFVRADGNQALVRTQSGAELVIGPGWLAVLPDGGAPGSDTEFAEPRSVGGPLSRWAAAGA